MKGNSRIYLSPPYVGTCEKEEMLKAFDSGWIAPVGMAIDEFEERIAAYYDGKSIVALNSGTSALHLSLKLAGIQAGDHVLVSSFTFAACANVILYERAVPVFLDSESITWNLDPDALEAYLKQSYQRPKALIVTHLYGMPAQIDAIIRLAEEYEVKVIEDAAEAQGAKIGEHHVGSFGDYGILSFNGNKLITTSAGGALICNSLEEKRMAIHLATQANDGGGYSYHHKEVGYNYRMSNLLAGLGIGQLSRLSEMIYRKQAIYKRYVEALGEFFDFFPEPSGYSANRWLTTALLKDDSKEIDNLICYLDSHSIESRRLWRPLHLHKAYMTATFWGSGVCEQIFSQGICLPSGSGMSVEEQDFVIEKVKEWVHQ